VGFRFIIFFEFTFVFLTYIFNLYFIGFHMEFSESSSHQPSSLKIDHLPVPDAKALQHSQQLLDYIISKIRENQGSISFAEYMEMALYAPNLGYYRSNLQKFGPKGDFVTAPELSPLFSHCLARQCQQILQGLNKTIEGARDKSSEMDAQIDKDKNEDTDKDKTYRQGNIQDKGDILEIGAGSGQMAVDLLLELKSLNSLPNHYYILELSANLQQRQYEKITSLIPEFAPQVHWVTEFPTAFQGIILANEVLDAMPVNRFQFTTEGIKEIKVTENKNNGTLAFENFSIEDQDIKNLEGLPFLEHWLRFIEQKQSALSRLHPYPTSRPNSYTTSEPNPSNPTSWPSPYTTEVNLYLKPWVLTLAENLKKGIILLIDYGFSRKEYYHPDRSMGTLMCHYRHYSHSDPFLYPGLQDITAHVDFTAVAEAAEEAKLEVLGFTHQAAFLLGCGLLDIVQNQYKKTEKERIEQNHAINILTSPSEMGELFKVMAIGKNFEEPLIGFEYSDQLYKL
jgi:SAM-dependent MidA family methyltransferase